VFDRIHVGACCPEAKLEELCTLLAPRGVLVTPLGDKLVKVSKGLDGKISTEAITSVRYGDLVIPSEAEVKEALLLIERKKASTVTVPPNTILTEFSRLVNCEEFSDIVFVVEGKKIFAHKLILNVRSLHFRAMLNSGMKESQQQEIEITGFTYDTMQIVMRFIYTGELANGVLHEDNWLELLESANYFKIERMKALCEQFLHSAVDIENVASLLQAADRFDARQLKSVCFEFILSHYEEVLKTKGFKELSQDLMITVVQAACSRLSKATSSSDN